ncbi:uncharacterized protein LOC107048396 [Diachasma alloeum]|uniref:uncharacterized protein LOC107048396 n=1 Tax=Diachasma alloeum TaxID=454923 RepID=UPI0007383C63|nr:uncharacterized protein LOC107048396 [Diachasma alloeum]
MEVIFKELDKGFQLQIDMSSKSRTIPVRSMSNYTEFHASLPPGIEQITETDWVQSAEYSLTMAQNASHYPGGVRVRDVRSTKIRWTKNQSKSIMERFDEMVNAQLQRHRKVGNLRLSNLMEENDIRDAKLHPKIHHLPKTLTSMSSANVSSHLSTETDNDLVEAVEALVCAEDMAKFAEKIVAAEAAVAAVPPELAEEAALAVTRSYQQSEDKVTKIKEVVQGDAVIEVVGYIGVRTRKNPSRHSRVNYKDAPSCCSCSN